MVTKLDCYKLSKLPHNVTNVFQFGWDASIVSIKVPIQSGKQLKKAIENKQGILQKRTCHKRICQSKALMRS